MIWVPASIIVAFAISDLLAWRRDRRAVRRSDNDEISSSTSA